MLRLLILCVFVGCEVDISDEERVLRAFDLATEFGPCTGITRLERYVVPADMSCNCVDRQAKNSSHFAPPQCCAAMAVVTHAVWLESQHHNSEQLCLHVAFAASTLQPYTTSLDCCSAVIAVQFSSFRGL
jgi:hypothetical protein